ncbi:ABC transporter ATP-binding protein [soil metagenome]
MSDLAVDATLDKTYPGCVVLTRATLQVRRGTVHALCGENGAGKSTVVKILAGVTPADAGTLSLDDKAIELSSWNRIAARAAAVGIVMQHGSSAETLSVVENSVLGAEGGAVLDLDAPAAALKKLGDQIGLPIDPYAIAGELTLGAAQRAEILAAIHHGATLLILDEPTAVLTPVEVEGLLATLRSLAAQGRTIIIVKHKLDEVRTVADDVTVLRAGKTVATFSTRDAPLDTKAIARAMVGADLPEPSTVPPPAADAPAILTIATTHLNSFVNVNLSVRSGEIAGIAGVDGNGQSELARMISGLDLNDAIVTIGDASVGHRSSARRLRLGLAHIHEDRQHGGLLLDSSVADNLVLGRPDITGHFRIDRSRVAAFAKEQVEKLDIRPRDPSVIAGTLSGGNQQKVVVARELSRPAIKVVLAVQPSRGVDLGAVAKIHELLRDAARAGAAVLVISADLDELFALCHTIHVMLRGEIVGTRSGDELRSPDVREALGALMTGASTRASTAAISPPEAVA